MKAIVKPMAYKTPRYPDKYSVDLKNLLLKNRPKRFASPIAASVLTATVMLGLASCSTTKENLELSNDPSQNHVIVNKTGEDGDTVYKEPDNPSILVYDPPVFNKNDPLRIFEHGDGTGAYGCEVISPPVYLSEYEAYEVIKNWSYEDVSRLYREVPRLGLNAFFQRKTLREWGKVLLKLSHTGLKNRGFRDAEGITEVCYLEYLEERLKSEDFNKQKNFNTFIEENTF